MTTTVNIRRLWRIAAAVVLFSAVIAAAMHGYATMLSSSARTSARPTESRLADADFAVLIEPWNQGFRATAAIVKAQSLLGKGKVDEAYFLLLPLSKSVRGDELFRQTYQATLRAKWPLDARKAHQQHAKEHKGGALDERDVWK